MQYYRCKCGKKTSYGSMPPPRCLECLECKTTLERHPDWHGRAEPHNYYEQKVMTDIGEQILTICRWCNKAKIEIEQ